MIVSREIGHCDSGVVPPTAKLPYRISAALMMSEVVISDGACCSRVMSKFWSAKHGDLE